MLLKGSGIFTHYNEQSHLPLFEMYSKLNGLELEDFVQRLFQMMKLSSTRSSSRSKISKYKQLIPEGIRGRDVVLVLSRDSAGNFVWSETEKLSSMKLKTTNKFQWFASLCSVILSPQSPNACKQLLQDYAREGAGDLGCDRLAQFGEVRSRELQLSCIAHNWADHTVQEFPLKLNKFWFVGDGSRNVAGLCHVTVTVASSSEKTVGNSSVCITLREVFMPEKHYRMHDEVLREDDLQPQDFLPSDIVSMGQKDFISLRNLLNCTLTWDVGVVEKV